jgi:membrane protease YdiL (CAAX protease family)
LHEGACSLASPDNSQFEPQSDSPQPRDVNGGGETAPAQNLPGLDAAPQPQAGGGQQTALPAIAATPRDPAWNGWDVLVIAALTLLTIPILGVFVAVGARIFWPHVNLQNMAPEIVIAAQFLGYIVVFLLIVMMVEGKYHVRFWKAIHWNWPRWGLAMFGLGVVLLLSINVIAHFLPMPKSTPFDQFFASSRDAYLMSIFAVTFGPFMEELFFRGLLYPVLARRLGVFWGVLLTAAPFAMMHMFQYGYAWGVVLLIFVMGIVVTIVRASTGSVAASFLVHVGYNATEMFALLLATDGFRHMEKAALG